MDEQSWNTAALSATVTRPHARLWAYDAPAVVLGSAQRPLSSERVTNNPPRLPMIARTSGGGAVLAGPWMLSASIVLPLAHPLVGSSPVDSYRWLGEAYAEVLRRYGIPARTLPVEDARRAQARPDAEALSWACFGGLSPWEVVVGDRKIVGLAQTKRRTGILLVGGLLLARPEWARLCEAMKRPVSEAGLLLGCTTSCEDELGTGVSLQEIANTLMNAFETAIERIRNE